MNILKYEPVEDVTPKKTDPDKTPWLTCSRCGSRRIQQKSEEKVRCLDCGYVEKFHIKHSYFLIEGNKDGNRKS